MNAHGFFQFHLTTLLVASVLAAGVIYLNLRHYREPLLYSGFSIRSGGTRHSMQADGKCVRISMPSTTRHFLTRVYLQNIGWPYSPWQEARSYSVGAPSHKDVSKYGIDGEEWKKFDFTPSQDVSAAFLFRDADILGKAPHLSEKIFEPPEPSIVKLDETNWNAVSKNAAIGLLIVLIPSIGLEMMLRKRAR